MKRKHTQVALKEEQHLFLNKKSIDIAHEFIPAFHILYFAKT